jgi:hypothetical protein
MIAALGKIAVSTPGTPVRVTLSIPYAKSTSLHAIMFEADPENTGNVYIGRAGMVRATRAGVYAMLAVPTANFFPTFSVALTIAPNGLSSDEFYIDADVAGDGAIATYLVT